MTRARTDTGEVVQVLRLMRWSPADGARWSHTGLEYPNADAVTDHLRNVYGGGYRVDRFGTVWVVRTVGYRVVDAGGSEHLCRTIALFAVDEEGVA